MNTLIKNTENEFFKLILKKKYIVILILTAGICLLRLGGGMLISRISGGAMQIKSNMLLEMLPFAAEIMAPLIVFMAVTDLFCSEMQEDTMKAVLMRPITRGKVMLSKIFAAFLMGALYYLVTFVVCLLLQIVMGGRVLSIFLPTLGAYIIDLIPLFCVAVFAVCINLLCSGPTLTMLILIAVYALFKYANFFGGAIGQMFFTAYLQWHKIWLGAHIPFGAMLSKIGILGGTVLIFYTVSYILFEKKEF